MFSRGITVSIWKSYAIPLKIWEPKSGLPGKRGDLDSIRWGRSG